jgi:hypothetical protein
MSSPVSRTARSSTASTATTRRRTRGPPSRRSRRARKHPVPRTSTARSTPPAAMRAVPRTACTSTTSPRTPGRRVPTCPTRPGAAQPLRTTARCTWQAVTPRPRTSCTSTTSPRTRGPPDRPPRRATSSAVTSSSASTCTWSVATATPRDPAGRRCSAPPIVGRGPIVRRRTARSRCVWTWARRRPSGAPGPSGRLLGPTWAWQPPARPSTHSAAT